MVTQSPGPGQYRRRWRDYRTSQGNRPVRDFLFALPEVDRAEIVAAMEEVAEVGLALARHLRGDIYEVRADCGHRAYRVLFAEEGRFGEVLLALVPIIKKSQRIPPHDIDLANQRLRDWRERGAESGGR